MRKIILGLDPGSLNTGFGVIEVSSGKMKYIDHGVISASPQLDFVNRLKIIGLEISEVVKKFQPDLTIVEKIFLGKNADSAFKLGHVRGICLFEALKVESRVIEYAARSVKKGIVGSGAATKEQVQLMLYAALGLKNLQNSGASTKALKLDASDALALAFYHARQVEFEERLELQKLRTLKPKTSKTLAATQTSQANKTPEIPQAPQARLEKEIV